MLTTTQIEALRILEGMLEITRNEMLRQRVYVTEHVVKPWLAKEGAICRGHQACAVGSMWIAAGIWMDEDGQMPGVDQDLDRYDFLAKRPALSLAYNTMNAVSSQYMLAEAIEGNESFDAPMELLFEAREWDYDEQDYVPVIDAHQVFPVLIAQAADLILGDD